MSRTFAKMMWYEKTKTRKSEYQYTNIFVVRKWSSIRYYTDTPKTFANSSFTDKSHRKFYRWGRLPLINYSNDMRRTPCWLWQSFTHEYWCIIELPWSDHTQIIRASFVVIVIKKRRIFIIEKFKNNHNNVNVFQMNVNECIRKNCLGTWTNLCHTWNVVATYRYLDRYRHIIYNLSTR